MKTIELKGIFRNTRGIKPLGTMTDLTNLRFKNGVLEPVGDKQLVDTFSNEVASHLGVHVISATQKNYIYQATGGQVGARINGSYVNITGVLVNPRISFVNNVLVVFSDNEDMLYYVYKDGLYNNVKTKIKDFDVVWKDELYNNSSKNFFPTPVYQESVTNPSTKEEAIANILRVRAEAEKKGVFTGKTWYCYTIVLFDSTEILHSPVREIETAQIGYNYKKDKAVFKVLSLNNPGITDLLLHILNKQEFINNKDLFRGIKVYAVRPPAIDADKFIYTYSDPSSASCVTNVAPWLRFVEGMLEWSRTPDFFLPFYTDRTLQNSDIFREIAFIETKSIKDTVTVTLPPLDTIDTLPALPIDNNTHLTLDCVNQPIVFNGRLIMSNIKNRLPEAPSSLFFKHYKTDPFHNGHGIVKLINAVDGIPTWEPADQWSETEKKDNIGICKIKPESFLYDEHGVMYDTQYEHKDYFWNGTTWVEITQENEIPRFLHNWSCFFEVTLKSEHGTLISRSKVIEFDQCRYQNGKLAFRVNTLFTYPDSRATNVKVYVRDKDANPRQWFYQSFELTNSDTNNYAYAEINTLFYAASEGVAQPSETFDHAMRTDGYTDQNRVQASEPNNPFILPAKNSYRVGHAAISRLSTVTEALSQGQFGQYPLVAFTDAGIWSLEIGSGDVFVSRVVPLANELSINADMITSIQGGIFFVTNEGLKVLSGSSVADISDPVEGKPGNTIYNHPGMVVPVAHRAVEDFKQYLKSAQAGYDYDNNEIIISKPAAPHSYAYSFDTKTWTMITQAYTGFINQFPHNYALAGNKMYELSKETTASKAVSFCTNYFGDHSFSKLIEGALRGQFDNATVQVYGSADGAQFALLCTRKATQAHSIMIPRLHYSLKYYIIAFHSTTSDQDHISHIEINTESRYAHKLR